MLTSRSLQSIPGRTLARALRGAAVSAAVAVTVAVGEAQPAAATPAQSLAAADHGRVLGSPDAKLWMLVVSDFQCPYCKAWHDSTWATIRREYVSTGKIRVAFVNFPLSIHRNARVAAIEAMCAAAQDKFWQVADALFATQRNWENLADPQPFFDRLAASARLDMAAHKSCLAGPAIPSLVDADQARMTRAGAASTPTFFIGGSRIEGAYPIDQFRRVIDAELAGRHP